MYSFVLMSAMATGGDAPSFHFGAGCQGASCSGAVPVGCGGYAVPVGCGGGCGGRTLFPLFPRLRARFSCGGCGGYAVPSSCHGSSYYGASCQGSSCLGYGFGGSTSSTSTGSTSTGYYAGSVPGGAGYGSSAPGGVYYLGNSPGVSASSFGFGFAGLPTFPQGYSMGGCYGTGVVGPYFYGADFNNPPMSAVTPGGPTVPPMIPPTGPDLNRRTTDDSFAALDYQASKAKPAATPARLTVELPADAVLFVDGEKVPGTGVTRNFHTPSLPDGTFFYDLKAEVTVDGQPVTETVRVMVKGGDAKTETFGKLIAAVKGGKSPALVSK